MNFKINFPSTPFLYVDENNFNIDIHIIVENNDVYFATIFTIENVKEYLKKGNTFFWSADQIIIEKLTLKAVFNAVTELINENLIDRVATKIGTIKTVYSIKPNYRDLHDPDREKS